MCCKFWKVFWCGCVVSCKLILERVKVNCWERWLNRKVNWVLMTYWWKYLQTDKGSCWVAIETENNVFFYLWTKVKKIPLLELANNRSSQIMTLKLKSYLFSTSFSIFSAIDSTVLISLLMKASMSNKCYFLRENACKKYSQNYNRWVILKYVSKIWTLMW